MVPVVRAAAAAGWRAVVKAEVERVEARAVEAGWLVEAMANTRGQWAGRDRPCRRYSPDGYLRLWDTRWQC